MNDGYGGLGSMSIACVLGIAADIWTVDQRLASGEIDAVAYGICVEAAGNVRNERS